jgi:hypothetical protein
MHSSYAGRTSRKAPTIPAHASTVHADLAVRSPGLGRMTEFAKTIAACNRDLCVYVIVLESLFLFWR